MAQIELLEAGISTEFIGVRTEGNELEALDGDPQRIFKPEDAIEPGWYRDRSRDFGRRAAAAAGLFRFRRRLQRGLFPPG